MEKGRGSPSDLEALRLLRAFFKVGDAGQRRQILELAEKLACAQAPASELSVISRKGSPDEADRLARPLQTAATDSDRSVHSASQLPKPRIVIKGAPLRGVAPCAWSRRANEP
jgi:hypothetical protein